MRLISACTASIRAVHYCITLVISLIVCPSAGVLPHVTEFDKFPVRSVRECAYNEAFRGCFEFDARAARWETFLQSPIRDLP